MPSLKEFADASDVWINVLIKSAIALLIVMVLFFPHSMPILRRVVVKSSEFNVEGVKFQVIDAALTGKGVEITDDGKLMIGGVDVSDFPDQNAKLRQTVSDLNAQVAKLNDTIAHQQQLLGQASHDLDTGGLIPLASGAPPRHAVPGASSEGPSPPPVAVSPPGPSPAPIVLSPASPPRQPPSNLAAQIQESAKTAAQEQTAAAAVVKSAAELVQQSTPLPGVGFGIVFGADKSPQAAMDEVRKVTKPPVSADPVILYKRQGSWRSVAYFGTRDAAKAQLVGVKSIKPDAYIVDISSWCPTPILISAAEPPDKVEQKDCQF
jgi:hypothetical protein